jgi:hypothetical protein
MNAIRGCRIDPKHPKLHAGVETKTNDLRPFELTN